MITSLLCYWISLSLLLRGQKKKSHFYSFEKVFFSKKKKEKEKKERLFMSNKNKLYSLKKSNNINKIKAIRI